jgi:FixJ family two-component response regulator
MPDERWRFMMTTRPLVAVVDDDQSVRESLPELLKVLGFDACAFSSAEEFLASSCVDDSKCLIADIAMPGMTGPELQLELTRRRPELPIIFVTAQVDEGVRRNVLNQGAIACLYKPFSEAALIETLARASMAASFLDG